MRVGTVTVVPMCIFLRGINTPRPAWDTTRCRVARGIKTRRRRRHSLTNYACMKTGSFASILTAS